MNNYINKTHSSLSDLYFNEVSKFQKLSKEDTYHLLSEIKDGNEQSFNLFVKCNLMLVPETIHRYFSFLPIPFLDAVSEGNIALVNAVRNYDHDKRSGWCNYAMIAIKRKISEACISQRQAVRLPIMSHKHWVRCRDKKVELASKLNRDPTVREVSDELNISEYTANWCLSISNFSVTSIDSLDGDHEVFVSAVESPTQQSEPFNKEDLEYALSPLTDFEKDIIKSKLGIKKQVETVNDIAKRYNFSREHIRMKYNSSIRKMKMFVTDNP